LARRFGEEGAKKDGKPGADLTEVEN